MPNIKQKQGQTKILLFHYVEKNNFGKT